jgi:tRNA modification GTPase
MTEAQGWPVRLVDTAGLRDTDEIVERMGIEISREYSERADVVLVCGDSIESLGEALGAVRATTRAPTVQVRTKADRVPKTERTSAHDVLWVSAESGEGLPAVAGAIAEALSRSKGELSLDAPLVTRERQRLALQRAREELMQFREAWTTHSVPPVIAAVHLRDAARELEELVGAIDVEDVLDRLFSSFCVGK